ncbi:MAG TPA: tetratricopeptide repeat-containing glycosyltransferase family protein, partial [Tepidisphaeraceae bacterium]|nr:tetratricopeptide repeat-containing glycosyltransferase family protein [Tepidisphaeraceae bacterium]
LRQAIRLSPGTGHLYGNLGMVLAAAGRFDDAIAAFNQAIVLQPKLPEAHNNLGNALREQGRFEQAMSAYNKALSLRPNFPDARWNLGLLLLMQGDFERGWPLYEARRQVTNFRFQTNLRGPQWEGFDKLTPGGSDLTGRTILLQSEQGFGDTIQFVRYAPLLARRGAQVMLQTGPELRRLLTGQCSVGQIISPGEPLPRFDFSSPLMTLPRILGTTINSVPAEIPYLRPDPSLVESWRRRVSETGKRLKVGLTWAGRPTHPGDRARSIPSALLSPLNSIRDCQFFSLQKWKPAAVDQAPLPMIDWTSELNDFADTAALLENLDLVITVDTAVAHLAGAMSRRVWVLLPFVPDWRWMLNRADSPWYPTMQLFRQPTPGNWDSVINNVCQALRKYAGME